MSVRSEDFFGFDWTFCLEEGAHIGLSAEAAAALPAQAWRPVQIPHDWSIDYPIDEKNPSCGSGGYFRTGTGWYKKEFALSESVSEKRLSLLFEGVYMNCTAWLNGKEVGGHVYGYTSFEIDITCAVRTGNNTLLMRVDNSMQPGSRWYSGSGITRDVWLRTTGQAYIPLWGVYAATPEVCAESAVVEIRTKVEGGADLSLETVLLNPKGEAVARCVSDAGSGECVQALSVKAPALWSHETPNLYTIVSKLMRASALLDETTTPLGIRSIEFTADNGFFINGEHVKLRGVCVHHDGGCVGAAVPPAIWRTRMLKLKAMGVNAIRCSHNPPDPAFLDLCDEIGFLVMDEAFDEWRALKGKEFGSNTHESRGYSEWFDQCYKEDLMSMLLRDRNHPSIVLWSVGNEVPEQKSVEGAKLAKELIALCHAIDPTRPVTQANDQIRAEPLPAVEEFLDALDVVGYNYFDRWRERTEIFCALDKQAHPHWKVIGSENGSVGGRRNEYLLTGGDTWRKRPYAGKSLKAEKLLKFTESYDYVAGDFMWTGIDHLGECFWPDKGSSSGVMDTCGFEKDGYYFYQSQWTSEPMLHLLPHWNMQAPQGTVIPVVCYTNCDKVELFVDGKSYGAKCYEFPAQGMSETYGHFERPIAMISTNDLHLAWDVPFNPGVLEAVGYRAGAEVIRRTLRTAGKASRMIVRCDGDALPADGRSVCQLTVELVDENGVRVPDADVPVTICVSGAGTLLGMDNGRPDCQTLFADSTRETYGGLAYAIVRAAREPGTLSIGVSAPGVPTETVEVNVR